jgi:hypothetical protein
MGMTRTIWLGAQVATMLLTVGALSCASGPAAAAVRIEGQVQAGGAPRLHMRYRSIRHETVWPKLPVTRRRNFLFDDGSGKIQEPEWYPKAWGPLRGWHAATFWRHYRRAGWNDPPWSSTTLPREQRLCR